MKVGYLTHLIEPTIASLGLVLWGCDVSQQGNHTILRVYIDADHGVTLDDCARASREIGSILDVENVIHHRYQLEVSSPGINRPLFTLAQFKKYLGEKVKVKLHTTKQGHRQFVAIIEKIENEVIFLKIGNDMLGVLLNDIQKAKLQARTNP